MSVEVRKMQKTSDGTFFLTLPKSWASRFNLVKGSPIYIRERGDGCIVLDPKYAVDFAPEVTIKGLSRIKEEIISHYLLGYEVIVIEAARFTSEDRVRIRRIISSLIGVEIVEEEPGRMVLQCPLKASAFSPDKILRREYVLSSEMFKDALRSFINFDLPLAESVVERDEEVDRLYFLIVRLLRTLIMNPRLSEKLNVSLIDCLDYRLISSLIEGIADQSVQIGRLTSRLHKPATPPEVALMFSEVGDRVKESYEEAVKAVFARTERTLVRATDKMRETEPHLKRLEERLDSAQPNLAPAILNCGSILQRIFGSLLDILDLVNLRK